MDALPPAERIGLDAHWRVAHATGTALPGWLVLLPRRHVTAIAQLTPAEAAGLGPWQVRLSRALHTVLGCRKTYVAQFAEADGFAHVHFHVVPRPDQLAPSLRGPGIFGLLGRGPGDADTVAPATVAALADLLRAALAEDQDQPAT